MTIQHLGSIDLRRIKEVTSMERMLRFHIQEYERFLKVITPVCSRVAGRHVDQTFAILDVKGARVGGREGLSCSHGPRKRDSAAYCTRGRV